MPMLAFQITGFDEDEYVRLSIDEVFGFPNETSYGGGYGAKGSLAIKTGEYYVSDTHYFTTGELYCFSKKLKICYENLSGIAILKNTERALELQCEFNEFGHVIITGNFQSNPIVKNILFFEIETDQTQIQKPLSDLNKIHEFFGDEKGIKC